MFNLAAHLALALGLLWFQKKTDYKTRLSVLTVFWYGIGSLLIFVEMAVLTGTLFSGFFLQGMMVELFYILPMYFALKWGKKHKDDIWHPFLMFLVFAAIATLFVGWFLANADVARGLQSLNY